MFNTGRGRGWGRGLFVPQRYNQYLLFQHSERRSGIIGSGIRADSLQPQRIFGETCNKGRGRGSWTLSNDVSAYQERRPGPSGSGIRADSLQPRRLVGETCNKGPRLLSSCLKMSKSKETSKKCRRNKKCKKKSSKRAKTQINTIKIASRAKGSNRSSPNVFLSYNQKSSKNSVLEVRNKIEKAGIITWFDHERISAGHNLKEKLSDGIEKTNVFLCFLCPSYYKSVNCRRELNLADELKKTIIPVLIKPNAWPPKGAPAFILSGLVYEDLSVMLHRVAPGALSSTLKNVACSHNRLICLKDSAILFNGYSAKCITLFSPYSNFRWKSNNVNENSSLSEVKDNSSSQLKLGQKVKETTKDASYLGVIIAGIGVTGVMFYAILSELFSGQSPNSIYTEALKLCRNDQKLVDILGEPIKGYGELSSRGRRRHVSHLKYEKNGVNFMRMLFYVEGTRKKGTVHLEMKQGPKGKYDYRYLFVDIDSYPPQTYIIKDNRHEDNPEITDFKM